jgi:hypothetical protein
MSLSKELVERIYIAGYKDGSVRVWDATFPILELMFVLNGKVSTTELRTLFFNCFALAITILMCQVQRT